MYLHLKEINRNMFIYFVIDVRGKSIHSQNSKSICKLLKGRTLFSYLLISNKQTIQNSLFVFKRYEMIILKPFVSDIRGNNFYFYFFHDTF